MDAVKEVGALLVKFKTACDNAKTNKATSEELLKFARLVEAEISQSTHRESLLKNAVTAVRKACETVERVTQRGGSGTLGKMKGAFSDAWNAEQDQKDLIACSAELNQALILLGNGLGADILRDVQGLAEQDARASQKILKTLAEMEAKADTRHGETMNGIGQLERGVQELLRRVPASGGGPAPGGGQFAAGPALRPSGAYSGQPVAAATSGGTTLKYPDGAVYEGQVMDGKPHGEGCFRWTNGQQYVGHFESGLIQGQGKTTCVGGNEGYTYEGQYRQGNWHGSGVFTYADGRQDRGRFENGKFAG